MVCTRSPQQRKGPPLAIIDGIQRIIPVLRGFLPYVVIRDLRFY